MKESSLDLLLQGRSEEFKSKVRTLVQKYNIDESDPTFILLIGTTTLEVLLEKYPQEFEQLFTQLLAQMDQRWGLLQREWAIAAAESATAAQQLMQKLAETEQVSKAEQEKIKTQAGSQAELLTTVYQVQSEQLKSEAEQLAAVAIAHAQATAASQVKDISKGLRKAYYLEAAGFACTCAAVLMFTSWTMAWISRGRAENDSVWGDIERWNGDELQACVNANLPTCNFHIKVPKEE